MSLIGSDQFDSDLIAISDLVAQRLVHHYAETKKRLAKLEAVAEAAKELAKYGRCTRTVQCPCPLHHAFECMRDALSALDEKDGNRP